MIVLQFGFTYIVTNQHNTVLYTGVSNNIFRRIQEHKMGVGSKFSKKYKTNKLVYYKTQDSIYEAIMFEKKIKNRNRKWKENLIESINPEWKDLALLWNEDEWDLKDLIN